MHDHSRLDCRGAMQQLWDYLDQELTPDRMAAIREHLHLCARCLPHAEFSTLFLDAIRRARREAPLPAALRERVMELIERESSTAS